MLSKCEVGSIIQHKTNGTMWLVLGNIKHEVLGGERWYCKVWNLNARKILEIVIFKTDILIASP